MTLLAGYDVVTEIGVAPLTELFRNNLQLQPDEDLLTPFELVRSINIIGLQGDIRLVVHTLSLDLLQGTRLVLELAFHHASFSTPVGRVCPLDGMITIAVDFSAAPVWNQDLQVDIATMSIQLGRADVRVQYSPASDAIISEELSNLPISAQIFKDRVEQEIQNSIRARETAAFPLGMRIRAGVEGSVTPQLNYSALEARCLGNADRARQSLALLGYMAPGNVGKGRPEELTSALSPTDQMAISIAPATFRRLIFCPSVATAFQNKARQNLRSFFPDGFTPDPAANLFVRVGDLPTGCGSAADYDLEGMKLKKLTDTFQDGHIQIDTAFEKSEFCLKAEGTGRARLHFDITGAGLLPIVETDTPNVDVDINGWCYLAGFGVLSFIGLGLVRIFEAVGEGIGDGIAEVEFKKAFNGLGATNLNIGTNAIAPNFTSANITREGFSLVGKARVTRRGKAGGNVVLVQDSFNSDRRQVEEGIWITKIPCELKSDMFPWKGYTQEQSVAFRGDASLAPPLQLTFNLMSNGILYPMTASAGSILLPGVPCDYAFPLGSAGTKVYQDVEVEYSVTNEVLTLRNRPAHGNFMIDVGLSYLDCRGQKVLGFSGSATRRRVYFEGQTAEIGGGFYDRVSACLIKKAREAKRRAEHQIEWPGNFRDPVPLGTPAPDEYRKLVELLANASIPGIEDIYRGVRATPEGKRLAGMLASPARVLRTVKLND